MAELSAAETTADPCCAPERHATCCEPSAKADCCGHEEGCGCAAEVRERYAAAAVQVTTTDPAPDAAHRARRSGEHQRIVARVIHRLLPPARLRQCRRLELEARREASGAR
jgi:hypothetical protein